MGEYVFRGLALRELFALAVAVWDLVVAVWDLAVAVWDLAVALWDLAVALGKNTPNLTCARLPDLAVALLRGMAVFPVVA